MTPRTPKKLHAAEPFVTLSIPKSLLLKSTDGLSNGVDNSTESPSVSSRKNPSTAAKRASRSNHALAKPDNLSVESESLSQNTSPTSHSLETSLSSIKCDTPSTSQSTNLNIAITPQPWSSSQNENRSKRTPRTLEDLSEILPDGGKLRKTHDLPSSVDAVPGADAARRSSTASLTDTGTRSSARARKLTTKAQALAGTNFLPSLQHTPDPESVIAVADSEIVNNQLPGEKQNPQTINISHDIRDSRHDEAPVDSVETRTLRASTRERKPTTRAIDLESEKTTRKRAGSPLAANRSSKAPRKASAKSKKASKQPEADLWPDESSEDDEEWLADYRARNPPLSPQSKAKKDAEDLAWLEALFPPPSPNPRPPTRTPPPDSSSAFSESPSSVVERNVRLSETNRPYQTPPPMTEEQIQLFRQFFGVETYTPKPTKKSTATSKGKTQKPRPSSKAKAPKPPPASKVKPSKARLPGKDKEKKPLPARKDKKEEQARQVATDGEPHTEANEAEVQMFRQFFGVPMTVADFAKSTSLLRPEKSSPTDNGKMQNLQLTGKDEVNSPPPVTEDETEQQPTEAELKGDISCDLSCLSPASRLYAFAKIASDWSDSEDDGNDSEDIDIDAELANTSVEGSDRIMQRVRDSHCHCATKSMPAEMGSLAKGWATTKINTESQHARSRHRDLPAQVPTLDASATTRRSAREKPHKTYYEPAVPLTRPSRAKRESSLSLREQSGLERHFEPNHPNRDMLLNTRVENSQAFSPSQSKNSGVNGFASAATFNTHPLRFHVTAEDFAREAETLSKGVSSFAPSEPASRNMVSSHQKPNQAAAAATLSNATDALRMSTSSFNNIQSRPASPVSSTSTTPASAQQPAPRSSKTNGRHGPRTSAGGSVRLSFKEKPEYQKEVEVKQQSTLAPPQAKSIKLRFTTAHK